jgi:FAD/FMN-containing dehydrogenase
MRRLRSSCSQSSHGPIRAKSPLEPTLLSKALRVALPDNVIFPQDTAAFKQSMDSYWAKQECDVVPACVVRAQNVQQLSTAVTILKREYDEQRMQVGNRDEKIKGLFAVRGGGHSPNSGAASINNGVLIDLGLFSQVIPSADRLSVDIGGGTRWGDVSKILDRIGLAVVGGRDSHVGVGGLILGGTFLLPVFGYFHSSTIITKFRS